MIGLNPASTNSFRAGKIDILSPLPTIMTRRILLSQVFANLLTNAINHHDWADGRATVSAEDLGDRYQFSIADDDPGIANREAQYI
jgi:signal transduction histidine kinase